MHLNNYAVPHENAGSSVSIVFRRARLSDLEYIVDIENTCFDYYRLNIKNFTHLITKGACDFIVAEEYGRICGYVIVLYKKNRSSARLYSIAVLPRFQNRGIGRMLMEQSAAVAGVKGQSSLYLEVKINSRDLVAFYEHQGFEKEKILKNYYGENDDGLVLRKSLLAKTASVEPATHAYTSHIPEGFVA